MQQPITIRCIDKCGGCQRWTKEFPQENEQDPNPYYLQREISQRDISNIQVLEKIQGDTTVTLVDNGEPTQELFFFMGNYPIYYEGRILNWRSKDGKSDKKV